MFQAIVTQAPAVYLAVIAGLLVLAAIQQLTLYARRGTLQTLDNTIANREYVIEQQAVSIRALNAASVDLETAVKDERRKAAKLILGITMAGIGAIKTANERAREFVKDRTDKAIAAIVAAEKTLERLADERDEALSDLEDANGVIASLRGGESGTVAEADFAEAADTAADHRKALDEALFAGTPFTTATEGPGVVPIQAVFTLDNNGVAVPENGAAKFLADRFGLDHFTKLGQKAQEQVDAESGPADDEACSTFNRPTVSLDDLKAALSARNGRH